MKGVIGAPSLFSFALVDTSSDDIIAPFKHGSIINAGPCAPPAERSIIADYIGDGVAGDDDGSIVFQLKNSLGQTISTQTENVAPFSLFGDRNGNYYTSSPLLVDGAYILTVTAYDANRGSGNVLGTETIAFTLSSATESLESLSLTLGDTAISESAGSTTGTIERSGPTTSALIVKLSSDDSSAATVPESVTILAGEATATFPVTMVSDALDDGYQRVSITASADSFTDACAELVVIDVDDPVIGNLFSFALVDTSSDDIIAPFENGSVINAGPNTPPAARSLIADYIGDGVAGNDDGSIVFQLKNSLGQTIKTQTENFAPFSLFGDRNGNYFVPGLPLVNAAYSLTVTAYDADGGSGNILGIETVEFTLLA